MNKSEDISIKKYFCLTGDGIKVYNIDLITQDFQEVIFALEQLNKINENKINARNN